MVIFFEFPKFCYYANIFAFRGAKCANMSRNGVYNANIIALSEKTQTIENDNVSENPLTARGMMEDILRIQQTTNKKDFTPDGDGINDTEIFELRTEYLEMDPEQWTVVICDQKNKEIK